jgi:murein DD-endopeptidase MepM/ murein hydrolase activator NlpD
MGEERSDAAAEGSGRNRSLLKLMLVACACGLLAGAVSSEPGLAHRASARIRATDGNSWFPRALFVSIRTAARRQYGSAAKGRLHARLVRQASGWAFGLAILQPPPRHAGVQEGEADVVFLWIAHRVNRRWLVALEYTSAWSRMLRRAPVRLSHGAPKGASPARKRRASSSTRSLSLADAGASQLSFPFAPAQTWIFNGPHNGAVIASRPWNAVDFGDLGSGYNGNDVAVAARDGTVTSNGCDMVRIDHGDGWATAYWHLHVSAGLGAVGRGAPLGKFFRPNPPNIPSGPCTQWGSGPHVHFAVYHYGNEVSVDGMAIGGWIMHAGASQYHGSATRIRDGLTVQGIKSGGSGRITNEGAIGSGTSPAFGENYTIANTSSAPVYTGPGTNYATVNNLPEGASVHVLCQVRGSTAVGGSFIWDNIGGHRYVADYDVDTPVYNDFSPGLQQCRAAGGSTFVMTSTGRAFDSPQQWSGSQFAGSKATLACDLTGNGKTDLVAVDDGATFVMLSNGSGFGPVQGWSGTPFYGSRATLACDVNGDHKTDLVAVDDGATFVMLSNGSGFGPVQGWTGTPFFGSRATLVADVNGDHRADLVAVDDGQSFVMLSDGSAFGMVQQWSGVPFYGSLITLAGDASGDGEGDLLAVNYDPGIG